MKLEDYLPGILDFPKPGIVFRDIAPLLADADALPVPFNRWVS